MAFILNLLWRRKMYITHDYTEEIKCDYCEGKVPYYEIKEIETITGIKMICEWCLEEMYQPEDI